MKPNPPPIASPFCEGLCAYRRYLLKITQEQEAEIKELDAKWKYWQSRAELLDEWSLVNKEHDQLRADLEKLDKMNDDLVKTVRELQAENFNLKDKLKEKCRE